ncbi:glycoside hydrolase family 13 protein [Actinosynnema sp. NPDC059797]
MNWWRGAAIYQVYPRSFADGNGDGIGDLAGLRQKLPHLAELGVDAIWLSPWYPSPMADGGYDVADYRDIEPVFGTLVEAEKFIAEAHGAGLRVIIDIVPNHCSDRHPWFQEALRGQGRDRFWFHDGDEPPNDWKSRFGGPAWSRTPDGGSWYLHLYSPEQPDLNWTNPEVRAEFESILRFWLDRGIDGFRIDVADGLVKDFSRPDADAPYSDQDGVHEIYRSWRRVLDEYPDDRVFVGEMWLPDPARFALYLRPDELHSAFNFDFLCCPWDPAELRRVIDATLAAHAPVGAPPTWVLSNHDVTRHVSRMGRADTSFDFGRRQHLTPTDLGLGVKRARAAIMLTTALPGCVYLYQGEELGLEEVDDLPDELRQDPVWERSGHTDRGRDGCRVPIPWGEEGPTWLPRPAHWASLSVAAQTGEPDSMLAHYRTVLGLRRAERSLGDGPMGWLDLGPGVVAFSRGDDFACVLNLSGEPVALPEHDGVLATSGPLAEGALPPDTAAWLRLTR